MGQAATRTTFTTPLGRALDLTRLGFGGAPLGNMHRALAEADAEAVVAAAWDAGLRYFDTAPLYGHGLSEQRIGRVLRDRSRDEFVVSTKVGRLLEPVRAGDEASGIYRATPPLRVRFAYSRDGVLRSVEESLARLGLARIDILYVHDVEPRTHGSHEAYEARWAELTDGGGWRALSDLRASGAVDAIGLGVNEVQPCERMLAELDPDLFLLAGRYTLLEQATGLLAKCLARGVGVVIGGPYNSGVLARRDGTFDYAAPPADVITKVEQLETVCRRFETPLAAAALQFAGAHPAVAGVIPGGQTADEVRANVALFDHEVPAGLWDALKAEGLVDVYAPTPNDEAPHAC